MGRVDGRLPAEALSEDGRQMRFLVGQLLSEYRKGQTGAGMSDAEREEYGRITGLVNSGSDAGVKQGLELLRRAVDSRIQATGAGFRPEAVETLKKRAPRLGKALTPAAPKAEPPTDTTPSPAPQGAVGERREYSRKLNKTRVLDAQGNVLRIEEGDTRGGP